MKKIFIMVFVLTFSLAVSPAFAHSLNETVLGDTYVNEQSPNSNYGTNPSLYVISTSNSQNESIMLMYNNSLQYLGGGFNINSLYSCMELTANGLDAGESVRVYAQRIYPNYTCGGSDTWNQTCPTWNTMPVAGSTMMLSNISYRNFNETSPLGDYCWNVLPLLVGANLTYPTLSIFMRAETIGGAPSSGDALVFSSMEGTVSPHGYIVFHVSPSWSLNSTNSTGSVLENVTHSVFWEPDVSLSMSHYIFSWDNANGTWTNFSAVAFGSSQWSNYTAFTPNTTGFVCWRMYANDTVGTFVSTEEFCYHQGYPTDLTLYYPEFISDAGTYVIYADYSYNGSLLTNATVDLCYSYLDTEECFPMDEGVGNYTFSFEYDQNFGGLLAFNVTAVSETDEYQRQFGEFIIPLFNTQVTVRFWNDLAMTDPYINEFMWVYARPRCDVYSQIAYLGLLDVCDGFYMHGEYDSGSATLSVWTPDSYDLYLVDGTVTWDCETCEPTVVGYQYWIRFDSLNTTESDVIVRDYLWNTTISGRYPVFSNPDWNFWLSVIGIIILIVVSALCAYFTENAIATLFIVILVYILLKLFGILTGKILFIF